MFSQRLSKEGHPWATARTSPPLTLFLGKELGLRPRSLCALSVALSGKSPSNDKEAGGVKHYRELAASPLSWPGVGVPAIADLGGWPLTPKAVQKCALSLVLVTFLCSNSGPCPGSSSPSLSSTSPYTYCPLISLLSCLVLLAVQKNKPIGKKEMIQRTRR